MVIWDDYLCKQMQSLVEGELTDNTQEIVSRGDPWAQDVTKGMDDGADVQEKIKKAMKSKCLPNWPSHIHKPLQTYSNKLHELHNQCCRYRTKKRLTMEKVVRKLNKIFHGPIGSKGH